MRLLDFFKQQFVFAHISGIPVRIDYRWFFVLIFITWLAASSIFKTIDNLLTATILGLITTLLFFASILLHELAHAFVARMEGIGILDIVLHPFGGMARMHREPDTPRAEFRIAVAGPAASFLIGLVFVALTAGSNAVGTDALTRVFFLLFFANMLLAVFNLFPGYPLDGGRVLRALLWRRGKDLNEATALTGRFGQIIAVVLIFFGLYAALVWGSFISGLWTIVVGVFLFDAATDILRQLNSFDNLLVAEVMQIPVAVAPDATVQQFVDRIVALHQRTIFPVAAEKQLYGFVLLADLKKLPREKWHTTRIEKVMRPVIPNYFVEADSYLVEAQILMRQNGIGVLGIIDKRGNLVGFLQRGRIKRRG